MNVFFKSVPITSQPSQSLIQINRNEKKSIKYSMGQKKSLKFGQGSIHKWRILNPTRNVA